MEPDDVSWICSYTVCGCDETSGERTKNWRTLSAERERMEGERTAAEFLPAGNGGLLPGGGDVGALGREESRASAAASCLTRGDEV